MKKINSILKNIFLISLTAFAVSCGKDNVEIATPDNQGNTSTENKNEEAESNSLELKWAKAELQFIEGHSHGSVTASRGYFHGNPEIEELRYLKPIQKLVFNNVNGEIKPSEDNQPVRWQSSNEAGGSLYGLKIVYYNERGERINEDFANNRHQHFFTIDEITANINAPSGYVLPKKEEILSYVYRDTNPENADYNTKSSNLRDNVNDPVGLKGVFVPKKAYVNFNLIIKLIKFAEGKKSLNGQTRDFNSTPPSGKPQAIFTIPIKVFHNRSDYHTFYENASKEYGVTAEIIEEEEEIIVEVDPHGEGQSPIYM